MSENSLTKFDLGYVPSKLHIIFLYFLRTNKNISALHCREINLKADLIKNLLREFIKVKEFTLSFSEQDSKKRDIGTLI